MRPGNQKELRELVLIVLLAACAYATVVLVNAHERFERWASSYEKWQMDELLILLGFVAMAAFVFAWRRWRETDAELARRKELHRKLEHRATHDVLTAICRTARCSWTASSTLPRGPSASGPCWRCCS